MSFELLPNDSRHDTKGVKLLHGDCLERMKEIPDGSVDVIITDPPYGNMDTDGGRRLGINGWDTTINHDEMLNECNRILRANGALILFSQEPYTSKIVTQSHGNMPFSYRLIWLKDSFANHLGVKKAPVNYTEDVCVFFKKHTKHDFKGFHPLRPYAKKILAHTGKTLKQINNDLGHRRAEHFFYVDTTQFGLCTEETYNELIVNYDIKSLDYFISYESLKKTNSDYRNELIEKMTKESPKVFNLADGAKYKSNVLEYKKDYTGLHPTQKPVALMADLIKTYTNEGETVLDFTMGSGSTGVAAVNTNRKFIGIERDNKYFEIADNRINETSNQL